MTPSHTHIDTDVAIIGSGFAGALCALMLRARGRRVVLLERGHHPRFAIGESTTPLTNLLLEEIADRYQLPRIRAFSKWGTWQRTHPDVSCGLKRGFTFVFHRDGEPFPDDAARARQLMVAASPNDDVADTHWYRPDFDLSLVTEAQAAGALYFDRTAIAAAECTGAGMTIRAAREGETLSIDAGFTIDASGPRGYLVNTLGRGGRPPQWLPGTQGLYTHFERVGLWCETSPPPGVPPYRPDDAALHHVFPGGWIWVLRFNNGITSAGAALTDALANEIRAHEGAEAWARLLDRLPSVRDQFRDAVPTRPFIHAPRIAFRCDDVVGTHWALLPSAAGVIDPLLSTGFPLTLLGIGRLVGILESTDAGPARQAALDGYADTTQRELNVTEQLVAALYACMADPELFTRLGLLYFAAASYSEAARRLHRPHLAPGFLLNEHRFFGAELRACAAAATHASGTTREALFERIDRAIEPFDTVGLLDRTRRGWYPVLAEDLIGSASKLDASAADIHHLLARCGFVARG